MSGQSRGSVPTVGQWRAVGLPGRPGYGSVFRGSYGLVPLLRDLCTSATAV